MKARKPVVSEKTLSLCIRKATLLEAVVADATYPKKEAVPCIKTVDLIGGERSPISSFFLLNSIGKKQRSSSTTIPSK